MGIKLNTSELRDLLNRSATTLESDTLDKLHAARRLALNAHHPEHRTPVSAWLYEHGVIGNHTSHKHSALNFGLAALLAVVIVGGFGYWQNTYDDTPDDVDIAILTDELPLHMYVD